MSMQKELVLERAREVVHRDIEAISENFEWLANPESQLPQTANTTRKLIENSKVDTTGTGPTLGLQVLNASFEDLDSRSRLPGPGQDLQPIGGLLVRLAGIKAQNPLKKAVIKGGFQANACQLAEEAFGISLLQAAKERFINQPVISVYHAQDGEPLLFRKEEEEATALTLVPLSIGGLVVPRGTIVTLDTSMDDQPSGHSRSRGFDMRSFTAPDELAIQPIRSSAWVYDEPMDRALFAVRGSVNKGSVNYSSFEYFAEKAALLSAISIGHYEAASRKIIDLCTG